MAFFTLDDLVKDVKIDSRINSDLNTTDDVATAKIIRNINNARLKIWGFRPWNWDMVDISFTQGRGAKDKTLDVSIGEIIILDAGGVNPLKKARFDEYFRWLHDPLEVQGEITRYIHIGRTSTKALKIRFWKTPADSTAIVGFGKKRINPYTVADIATNTQVEYFPDRAIQIVKDFSVALTEKSMGGSWFGTWQKAQEDLETLASEEFSQFDENEDTPPPDYIKYVNMKRASLLSRSSGGSTVV